MCSCVRSLFLVCVCVCVCVYRCGIKHDVVHVHVLCIARVRFGSVPVFFEWVYILSFIWCQPIDVSFDCYTIYTIDYM